MPDPTGIQGEDEADAPRFPLLRAARRRPALTSAPVLVLVAVALTIGLLRSPTYTSEARLNVGGFGLTFRSIPSYANAGLELATGYAGAIHAARVVDPVSRELRLSASEITRQTSATAIVGSPVIRVIARGGERDQVTRLANAMSDALVAYGRSLNLRAGQVRRLQRRLVSASRKLEAANARARTQRPSGRARSQADVARLELQTAQSLYQRSQANQLNAQILQTLAPAGHASSDRRSVLELLLACSLALGLALGLALASARARTSDR